MRWAKRPIASTYFCIFHCILPVPTPPNTLLSCYYYQILFLDVVDIHVLSIWHQDMWNKIHWVFLVYWISAILGGWLYVLFFWLYNVQFVHFLYMCFVVSPYDWLRVPAYLGTRGRSKIGFLFLEVFLCNFPLVNHNRGVSASYFCWSSRQFILYKLWINNLYILYKLWINNLYIIQIVSK